MRLIILQTVLYFMILAAGANAASDQGAGLRRLDVVDPVGQAAMDAAAFYPSAIKPSTTLIGPFVIAASKSAPVANGRYPLILLSHGSLGSMWGHHDLATFLARRGFIVVSITHPGDNFSDASRVGSTHALYGRGMQISAALTAALKDPVLSAHIDPERIAFAGFSAGGTTGLILAGAKPDLARFAAYCADRPQNQTVCEAKGYVRHEEPEQLPLADVRIHAFVLLAPLSVVFSREALKNVSAPMAIFVGGEDEELSPQENAFALARDLDDRAEFHLIANAGHFTFLAPCTTAYSRAVPVLCTDRPGIDRADLHRRINADIAAFFDRSL